ncbi:N-succinyldiaminopimelate aminotransferase [Staphylococcus chromogenes]|uniref:Aminotransferase n=1 Tax=Staphylococcus chromogenes TaxID=46126 RepID=A0AAE5W879_STACR|nr:aminotransferase class I/II-fold pyridoxal phosphate-dependent enzyme [Staphylococcus chromogenes]MBV5191338.1 aminotransferase class I/II-fold pyridoxal phosphate-dependent enzyme [Staphylococcus chromogenes]MBW3132301.1 aminotransferase class I/II-fold pyridoxal phosphate-dependent enzyme [Staphylococcus chromogenes]MDT0655559.1 aminotransferase class I/II-fold pyridoxal phosphate-dependent enzyme [Staphylococcus chromogenes]MDT0671947.1 aminotransferase class I/II-fold pyridoxal phosphate
MSYTTILDEIPESYFGKTMGKEVKHGPLPLINLAVGIPDADTPETILKALEKAIREPVNQKYLAFHGKAAFKQAIVDFYDRHFGVTLDPETEVCLFYGTKNGLVALPTCVIEPGDKVLLPDPGYTDYEAGVRLAHGQPQPLKLYPEHHYLPQWEEIDTSETKLIYLTYPNNPTGSVASPEFFQQTMDYFKDTDTMFVHDFAYQAFGFDAPNPSLLAANGAKERAIEVFSFSKGYNMSGYRVGFAVGNKEMIANLKKYHTHTQAGMYGALQDACTVALNDCDEVLREQANIFKQRRNLIEEKLKAAKIPHDPIKGGIFLWLPCPPGFSSDAFVEYLLAQYSILVAPGHPFGSEGEGYVRVSFAIDESQLLEALKRLTQLAPLYH